MRVFLTYFYLELKKSIKVMLHSAVSITAMVLMLIGGIFLLGYTVYQSQIFNTITVGVVIPEDASELQLITRVISSMDSVQSICSFEYLEQDKALEELYDKEIQAVIALPESLYQDIYTGQSAKVTVYFPKETTLSVDVFQEMLHDGVKLIQIAEAGVYAARDTSEYYKANMDIYEVAQLISYSYIQHAFQRGEIFVESVLLPFGEVGLKEYYVATAISVLLLMCGISFSYLYPKQSKIIEQKLRVNGLGAAALSIIKIVIMTCFIWLLMIVCYLVFCCIGTYTGLYEITFKIGVFLQFLPLVAAVSTYFHLIYSLFQSGSNGTVFLLFTNIFSFLCSGLIIPSAYMPDGIASICRYLPVNYMNQICAELLFGTVDCSMYLILIAWSILLFFIGAVITCYNISRGISSS